MEQVVVKAMLNYNNEKGFGKGKDDDQTDAEKKKVVVKNWCCWNWKQEGKFSNGDQCKFSHDPANWMEPEHTK